MSNKNIVIRSKLKQAESLLNQNKLHEAISVYESVCRRDGSNADVWLRLGTLQRLTGDYVAAECHCRKAVMLSPKSALAHHALGAALHSQGQTEKAIECYKIALQLQPDHSESLYYLANGLRETGQLEDAVTSYKRLLNIYPDHFPGLNNYGALLTNIEEAEEAIRILAHALEINNNSIETLTNLARANILIGSHIVAIKYLEKVIRIQPGFLDAHIELAWALRLDSNYDKALKSFENALELAPGLTRALIGKAKILEILGRHEEACEIIQPFIKDEASAALPLYYDLSRHHGEGDKAAAMIKSFLEKSSVNVHGSAPLHFRLGKYYDKASDYNSAFGHFKTANSLSKRNFSIEKTTQLFNSIKTTYNRDFIKEMPRATNNSRLPVFIVGMPRSGTSLLEQILASHPDIYGAGETTNIEQTSESLTSLHRRKLYPEYISQLTPESLDKAASVFLQRLTALSTDAKRITDKMPHNFVFIGLILQLFPDCQIIHSRRNPLDTCLSCYFSEFASNFHNYTYNLGTLGSYYGLYQDIMNHWLKVFPNKIYEVSYEELVSDQERVSRDLIRHCGLEWNNKCLDFYKSDRVVNTISYNQVRQPMYSKSVNRAQNYMEHLTPLLDSLKNYNI